MSSEARTAAGAAPQLDRHARRREQTRRKLLDAARALFARQGVDNTRINEITDEADVGFGSFYNHFDSKDAIVEAVLAETVGAQGAALETVTSELDDPAEVVAASHRYFVNLARSDPDWGWLLIRLDLSQKISFEALRPFAQRDLERGIRAGRFDRPRQARRAVRRGRRAARGHAARARRTGTARRGPPPRRGRAAPARSVGRGRGRGGAPAAAEDPAGSALSEEPLDPSRATARSP